MCHWWAGQLSAVGPGSPHPWCSELWLLSVVMGAPGLVAASPYVEFGQLLDVQGAAEVAGTRDRRGARGAAHRARLA